MANTLPNPQVDAVDQDQAFLQRLSTLYRDAVSGGGPQLFQDTLDAAIESVNGARGFLALVQHEMGQLTVMCTSGPGWTDDQAKRKLYLDEVTRSGITGHVALTGEPYSTGDAESDPFYLRYFADTRSEIAVPIIGMQGETCGVINIESDRANAFDTHDCAHLMAIAQAAATAIGVDGFRARESALVEIGTRLASTLDVDKLMKRVVEIGASALQFEDCSVFLLDEQTDHLVLHASRGALSERAGEAAYRVGEGLTGWVAEHAAPIRLEDPRCDPRWLGRYTEMEPEEMGAFLAVPILSRDKVLGVLRVLRRKSNAPWFPNRFTDTDERVLSVIAGQVGAAVANARNFQRLVRAERMAAWGELSAKSAHMIGNRTFALKGDLNEMEHLVHELCSGSERGEILALVESMNRGIERLEEILKEFRDFVMATQLALSETDINALIHEVVAETFPKRSKVKLELQLGTGLPALSCDQSKLKRAFGELVENAVSFQPDGGTLRISSRLLDEENLAELRLAPSRTYVEVSFEDEGPGVMQEIKERIFRPFFTSRVKGMGLGLSIVKGVVEAHQGVLREVGTEGEGAKFLIFLPVMEN